MPAARVPFLAPGVVRIEDYADINFLLRSAAVRVPADRLPTRLPETS